MPLDMPLIKDMTAWRQHLHRHPECGFDLPLTSDFIAEKLESFGIETVRGIGQSGIVGILRNGSSDRSVGLRADLDALFIAGGILSEKFGDDFDPDKAAALLKEDGLSARFTAPKLVW